MRVPATLLLLLCATPVGSAFGLVGGGDVWHASGSRCARHDCSGPHQQQGAGIGLSSCLGFFAFAQSRISYVHPSSVVATTKSRNNCHVLRAASEEDGTSEERAKILEERKGQLRVLLSASRGDIDKLVHHNPSVIIRSDIERNYEPKLKLLQERLGIKKKAAGRLCLIANRLLNLSLSTLEVRIDWLQAKLNLNKSQMRKIIKRSPNILTFSIEENLEPTIDNIQSIFELSDEELAQLIDRAPDVLIHNISAENTRQRFSLLQEVLGLQVNDIEGLRKFIKRAPQLLFWQEESMLESQKWIQQRFGLKNAKIAQMCRNQPGLLYANTTTLGDKADSIQADLSLSDDELSDLVSKYPAILSYCPEKNLRPKLRYLRTRFELDDDALKTLVLRARPLFGLSEDNIEEKFQFYSNLVGEREAKRLVIKSSILLQKVLKS